MLGHLLATVSQLQQAQTASEDRLTARLDAVLARLPQP